MKLTEYISKNNLNDYFNMICIDDNITKVPSNITVVPTIIDEDVEAPLEGKKAFEYVINQKYFNHPTNNIEFIKNGVPKPTIEEDSKAVNSRSGSGFIYVDNDSKQKFTERDERSNFDKVFNINNQPSRQQFQQALEKPIVQPVQQPVQQPHYIKNIDSKKLAVLAKLKNGKR